LVNLYINGVFQAQVATLTKTPTSIAIVARIVDSDTPRICNLHVYESWKFDDITMNSAYTNIITTIPEGSRIVIDPEGIDPNQIIDASGTQLSTTSIHSTYGFSPTMSGTSVSTEYMGGGTIQTDDISTSEKDAGIITVPLSAFTETGFYSHKLYHGDSLMDTAYFQVVAGLSDVTFDKTSYTVGDTATVSWDLDNPDLSSQTYKGELYNLQTGTITTWDITSDIGTKDITLDSATCEGGDYFAIVKLIDGTDEYWVGYDAAKVTECVTITGNAYNLETGAPLEGVTYEFTQLDNTISGTTGTGGAYTATPFVVDNEITTTATLEGYSFQSLKFTPLVAKTYNIDLYLMPDEIAHTNTTVAGMVHDNLQQPVPDATVNLDALTTTASNTGYYIFSDIPAGTHNLTSEKDGWTASSSKTVTATEGNITTQNLEMAGIYGLTIDIRDANTHALIADTCSVELQQGGLTVSATQTSGGVANFTNLQYGIYTALASSTGYYSNVENILVDSTNQTETIYLTAESESSSSTYYTPHNVKFYVKGTWGEPVADVAVTATYQETSGPLDWLYTWLGLSDDLEVEETSLSGTTGTDGSINFLMIECVKYEVIATQTDGTEATMEIYPKDDEYTLYFGNFAQDWFKDGTNPQDIQVAVSTSETDETNAIISVHYTDPLLNTTAATVTLSQTFTDGTEAVLEEATITEPDAYANLSVSDQAGQSYKVHVDIEHGDFSEHIIRDYGVSFKTGPINLGLPEGLLLYAAMFIILFTGLLIPETQRGPGAIFVCFEMWILYAMGWWESLASPVVVVSAISLATLMAFFFNFMLRSKKVNFGV